MRNATHKECGRYCEGKTTNQQIVSAEAMASPSQVWKIEIEDNIVQAAIEKNQVKSAHMKTMTIQSKLDAYEKHKDTIIRKNGEEYYHKQIYEGDDIS